MEELTCFRVRLELRRIQTYLFAVPRLRTILGANALIGEALRIELPELAVKHGCELPGGVIVPQAIKTSTYRDDPLAGEGSAPSGGEPDWKWDGPSASYERGVLTRDGGHFQALFPLENDAKEFVEKATEHLEDNLPGLSFNIWMEKWQPRASDESLTDGWKPVAGTLDIDSSQAVSEKPDRPVCELSGQGAGEVSISLPAGEEAWVSRAVKHQWDQGDRFRHGESHDIIGLMRARGALPCFDTAWQGAEDLGQLAGGKGRYLALTCCLMLPGERWIFRGSGKI